MAIATRNDWTNAVWQGRGTTAVLTMTEDQWGEWSGTLTLYPGDDMPNASEVDAWHSEGLFLSDCELEDSFWDAVERNAPRPLDPRGLIRGAVPLTIRVDYWER